MKTLRIPAHQGHYEVEAEHAVSVSFAVSGLMMRQAKCDVLNPMFRIHRLPSDCVALNVKEEWNNDTLYTTVQGARQGHYRFVAN